MSIIADNKDKRGSSIQAFTLIELLVAVILSAVVFAAIFSAYIFMARNLARLASFEQQQVQYRHILLQLAKDAGNATQITTASTGTLGLIMSSGSVTYTYDPINLILTRTDATVTPNVTTTLLSNLTQASTFGYYDYTGTATTVIINIKQIELSYSTAVGSSANGTRSGNTVVSARFMLRNKSTRGP